MKNNHHEVSKNFYKWTTNTSHNFSSSMQLR